MARGALQMSLANLVDYLTQEEEDQAVPLSLLADAVTSGARQPISALADQLNIETPIDQTIRGLNDLRRQTGRGMMQLGEDIKGSRSMQPRGAMEEIATIPGHLMANTLQGAGYLTQFGEDDWQDIKSIAGAAAEEAMDPKYIEGGWVRPAAEAVQPYVEEPYKIAQEMTMGDVAPGVGILAKLGMAMPFVQAGRRIPVRDPYGPRAGTEPVKAITEVNLRDMEPAEALDEARRGRHLKQDKTGQYIGAPRGIDTPDKLKKLRDNFDRLVEEGVAGAEWYDRARGGVSEMAGIDPARQDLVSSALAQYSAQANPDVNMGFALNALNQQAAGQRTGRIRTGAMDDRFFESVEETGVGSLGPKTGVYEQKINPRKDVGTTGTNDIWHARALGYVEADGRPWDSGLSPQQHAFMDAETVLAAGRANDRGTGRKLDWDAASVQAAPWIAAKGKDLHRRFPKSFPTEEAGLEEAAKTYIDYLPKYTAYGTYERIPGAGTGHLEGIVDAPAEVREEFTRKAPSYSEPETGRDILYDAAGMQVRPTLEATGYFEGPSGLEVNPANIARPMVSTEYVEGTSGPRTIRPQDKDLMGAVESTRAYIDAQNMGAWHKPIPIGQGANVAEATSFRVEGLKGPITEQQMRDLSQLVEPYGLGISDTGDGVTLMQFGESTAKEAKQFVDRHADDIATILPGANKVMRVKLDADAKMVDEDWSPFFAESREGTGQATAALRQALQGQNIPDTMRRLDADPRIREIVLGKIAQDDAIAQQLNLPLRADIQRARQFIVEGGFGRLFAELDKGTLLPAIGVPLISLGLASRDNERR